MWTDIFENEEAVRAAAETSPNIGQALDKLSVPRGGKAYRFFEQACDKFGIDRSFPERYLTQRTPLELVLIKDSPYTNNKINIKKWLVQSGQLEYRCSMYGCPNPEPTWNGRPLTLQLDHINGVNNDHRIENLRILCPNCHTQTETYAGRKRP